MHNKKHQNSTQNALYFFIVLGQCFALFPVSGIGGNNCTTIKFTWSSKRTLISIFYLILVFINACLCFVKLVQSKRPFDELVVVLYFLTIFFAALFFLDLARKWPNLMEKWTEIDTSMISYNYAYNLKRKLKLIVTGIIISAIVEHILFIVNAGVSIQGLKFSEKVDTYLQRNFNQVFSIIPYNIYLGLFMQLFNIFCTFAWNYMDLFVMIISVTLSYRFVQITKKIKVLKKYKTSDDLQWRRIREDYVKLNLLCKMTDENISNIVVLSFANNLFVILVQFMRTLHQNNEYTIQRIYFAYSFGFLIIRTIFVCLYGATIYSESRKPMHSLNSLPSSVYNIEVERLLIQIKVDPAYFTGRQFFKITKSLILHIAGAIVTYELVFIQLYYAK